MIKRIYRAEYGTDLYVTFPENMVEHETEQGLHNSFSDLTGADYAYDMIGVGRAAKKNAIERISFLIVGATPAAVNAAYEAMADHLQGRIKLWRHGDDESGNVEEWAYARLLQMPQISLTAKRRLIAPVLLIFERISDWEEAA